MRMDEEGFAERIQQDQQARKEACKILEVAENADRHTIKKAYRRACRKYHPDCNPSDEKFHDKFLLMQCAYEFLTKDKIDKILIEKIRSVSPTPPTTKYNLDNTWGYFLWWREQFFNEF